MREMTRELTRQIIENHSNCLIILQNPLLGAQQEVDNSVSTVL